MDIEGAGNPFAVGFVAVHDHHEISLGTLRIGVAGESADGGEVGNLDGVVAVSVIFAVFIIERNAVVAVMLPFGLVIAIGIDGISVGISLHDKIARVVLFVVGQVGVILARHLRLIARPFGVCFVEAVFIVEIESDVRLFVKLLVGRIFRADVSVVVIPIAVLRRGKGQGILVFIFGGIDEIEVSLRARAHLHLDGYGRISARTHRLRGSDIAVGFRFVAIHQQGLGSGSEQGVPPFILGVDRDLRGRRHFVQPVGRVSRIPCDSWPRTSY